MVNTSLTPSSSGGTQAATAPNNNGANAGSLAQIQDPKFARADFNDAAPENLRVENVLPSSNLAEGNTSGELFDLVGQFNKPGLYAGLPSSDHKAVWWTLQFQCD